MKHLFLSALLCLFSFQAFSQNNFFVRASVNPLVMPLGDTGFKEYGLGFYEFSYTEKPMQEYGLIVGKKIANDKLALGLGINYKQYRTEFDFNLHLYHNTESVFYEMDGFIEYNFVGLKPFTSYQVNDKIKLQFAIEINAPIDINDNNNSSYGIVSSSGSYNITITRNEYLNPSYNPLHYVVPEFQLAYNVYPSFDITLGFRYKVNYNKEPNYQLLVDGGSSFEFDYGDSRMNDSRIYRNIMAVSLGIDYTFDFKKKKKK